MEPVVPRKGICYFCNQTIDKYNEQGHIITCGSVLEPCPNKCGSYVQRKMKKAHMQECINRMTRSRPATLERPARTSEKASLSMSSSSSSPYPNDTKQMQQLQNELWRLGTNLNKIETNFKQLAIAVDGVRKEQSTTRSSKASMEQQRKLETDKIHLQYQMIQEWRKQIVDQIESVKNQISENNTKCRASDMHVQNRLALLDQLLMDLNLLRQNFSEEQRLRQEAANLWRTELDDFKSYFQHENAMIGAIWTDHTKDIAKLQDNLNDVQGSVVDLTTKHHQLLFEVKGNGKSLLEIEDSVALQAKEIKEIQKGLVQLQSDFSSFEEIFECAANYHQTTGKLMWKITDYGAKMEQSKNKDLMLKSPSFYSHEYGYRIRVEVYLNGIKKWKGRHLIASLRVLKGNFDALLSWPCNIEGSITLRDQKSGFDAKNYKKYIAAKRQTANEDNEEPQESSSQYIFISHSTLSKNNYIKSDSIFLEIEVNASNYIGSTSINNQNGHTLV